MKKLIFIIVIALLFGSCKALSFDEKARYESKLRMHESKHDHYRAKEEVEYNERKALEQELKECKNQNGN